MPAPVKRQPPPVAPLQPILDKLLNVRALCENPHWTADRKGRIVERAMQATALAESLQSALSFVVSHGGACSCPRTSKLYPGLVMLSATGLVSLNGCTSPNPGEDWFEVRLFNFESRFEVKK